MRHPKRLTLASCSALECAIPTTALSSTLNASSRTLACLGHRNADFGVVGLASGGIWRGTYQLPELTTVSLNCYARPARDDPAHRLRIVCRHRHAHLLCP